MGIHQPSAEITPRILKVGTQVKVDNLPEHPWSKLLKVWELGVVGEIVGGPVGCNTYRVKFKHEDSETYDLWICEKYLCVV